LGLSTPFCSPLTLTRGPSRHSREGILLQGLYHLSCFPDFRCSSTRERILEHRTGALPYREQAPLSSVEVSGAYCGELLGKPISCCEFREGQGKYGGVSGDRPRIRHGKLGAGGLRRKNRVSPSHPHLEGGEGGDTKSDR
ncbi:unnamed protein product, partial [Discosporangium mesarthrocarpum]